MIDVYSKINCVQCESTYRALDAKDLAEWPRETKELCNSMVMTWAEVSGEACT